MKTDIAIAGCGGSGLCAAIAAAESGKKAVIFEKAKSPGGNSVFPRGGTFAVGSRYQKNLGIDFDVDDVYKVIMTYTHYRANSALLRAFLEKSADTIDWIEAMGAKFCEVPPHFVGFTRAEGGYPTGVPIDGTGKDIVDALLKKASELGIEIVKEARVKKILKENGRVSGISIEKNGTTEDVSCDAVIIASGGCGNSPEMVKEYTGFDLGKNIFTLYEKGMTGDGLKLAWEAGAAKDGLGCQIIFGSVGPGFQSRGIPSLQQEPQLIVNRQGKRFMDENLANPTFKGNIISRQPGGCAFLVFDRLYKEEMEQMGFCNPNFFFPSDVLDNFDETVETLTARGNKCLFRAASLEELCEKTGIDFENFSSTVKRYNELCELEEDLDFKKNSFFLNPVKTGDFYALKLYPTMYGTIGGIRVNEKLQALDEDFYPVPGLYAAGYDANGCLGWPVPDYTMITPGLTFGFALNSGRMAGESAAEYVSRL